MIQIPIGTLRKLHASSSSAPAWHTTQSLKIQVTHALDMIMSHGFFF